VQIGDVNIQMTGLLEKHNKIIYMILSLLCAIVAYISRQYYILIASPILILMAIGVLDGREDEKQHMFYENLLEIFEKKEDIEKFFTESTDIVYEYDDEDELSKYFINNLPGVLKDRL